METMDCKKCNRVFTKEQNESVNVWSGRKYCSKSCANSVSRNGRGNKGKTSPFRGMKFPERSGENNPRNTQIMKTCLECKCIFMVQAYRKATANFCSHVCASQYRDEGKTPANDKIRKSWAYKAWRNLVFERDDYTCQECEQRGGYLHADHIKPFALHPKLRLSVDNGKTLCIPCHKKTDTYGRVGMFRTAVADET